MGEPVGGEELTVVEGGQAVDVDLPRLGGRGGGERVGSGQCDHYGATQEGFVFCRLRLKTEANSPLLLPSRLPADVLHSTVIANSPQLKCIDVDGL